MDTLIPEIETASPILTPNSSFQNMPPSNKFTKSKLIIILSVLIFLIILLGALFYFKILPIQTKIAPLSQKPQETKSTTSEPLVPLKKYDEPSQIGPFVCPATSNTCSNKANFKNNVFSANLPSGTELLAAFEGNIYNSPSVYTDKNGKEENFNLIVLTNKTIGIEATYYFQGEAKGQSTAKAGEPIATTSKDVLKFKGNKTLVFELMAYGEKSATISALTKESFK